MASRIDIADFPRKVDLALKAHPSVKNRRQLAVSVRRSEDYLSRIISGTRALTDEHLDDISHALGLAPTVWELDLEDFAQSIGKPLSEVKPEKSEKFSTPEDLDFEARIREPKYLRQLYDLIGGYWESYYYSVSKDTELVASRDLVRIEAPNRRNVLPVTIVDAYFRYHGWCFPVQHHIYMFLEKQRLLNEVIVYMLNTPHRIPPRLDGLILCKSDGENGFSSVPSAARISFRFLGSEADLMQIEGVSSPNELRDILESRVPGYVTPDGNHDQELNAIFARIRNTVTDDQLPHALRVSYRA